MFKLKVKVFSYIFILLLTVLINLYGHIFYGHKLTILMTIKNEVKNNKNKL